MTTATREQIIMLQQLWGKAKVSLKLTGKNDRERRLNWTETVIKRRVESWSDLGRKKDVDDLKGALLAIVQPDNVDAQLKLARQSYKRAMWRLQQLMTEMGVDRNYVQGVADRQIFKLRPAGATDDWQAERTRTEQSRPFAQFAAEQLGDLISALRDIKRRGGAKARDYVLK